MTQSGRLEVARKPRIPSIKEIILSSGSQLGGLCAYGASFRGAETPRTHHNVREVVWIFLRQPVKNSNSEEDARLPPAMLR